MTRSGQDVAPNHIVTPGDCAEVVMQAAGRCLAIDPAAP